MPLVIGLIAIAGAVLLLTSGITDASFADVITGKAGQLYRGNPTPGAVTSTGEGSSTPATGSPPSGVETPAASWNPLRKPIAAWIVPILQWASQHGWTGTVTSGYRSYSQQATINASGAYSAPAGDSNHESTTYPGGAVDVTNPSQLEQVLTNYPGAWKLIGGVLGAVDPEHFSATGH